MKGEGGGLGSGFPSPETSYLFGGSNPSLPSLPKTQTSLRFGWGLLPDSPLTPCRGPILWFVLSFFHFSLFFFSLFVGFEFGKGGGGVLSLLPNPNSSAASSFSCSVGPPIKQ